MTHSIIMWIERKHREPIQNQRTNFQLTSSIRRGVMREKTQEIRNPAKNYIFSTWNDSLALKTISWHLKHLLSTQNYLFEPKNCTLVYLFLVPQNNFLTPKTLFLAPKTTHWYSNHLFGAQNNFLVPKTSFWRPKLIFELNNCILVLENY